MSQGSSRRPFSRGSPRWHQPYKEYWDCEQHFRLQAEPTGALRSGSPKELAVSPKPSAAPSHYAPPVGAPHLSMHHSHDARRQAEASAAGPSRDPLMLYHHHYDMATSAAPPLHAKRPRLHNYTGEAAIGGGDRRPPRRHNQPPRRAWDGSHTPLQFDINQVRRRAWDGSHTPLQIDINQMQYRNWRESYAGRREAPPAQRAALRPRPFCTPRYVATLHPHHPHHPHHLHHPYHPYHQHHPYHQMQGGAVGGGGALVSPAPTYQVFLNVVAMFPVGAGSPPAPPSPTNNYEQLLTLAERLGERDDKPRGLEQSELDALPLHTHPRGSQCVCVVCMCEFERTCVLRELPCGHEFHAACVDTWLRSNRTCPICRGVVGAPRRTTRTH